MLRLGLIFFIAMILWGIIISVLHFLRIIISPYLPFIILGILGIASIISLILSTIVSPHKQKNTCYKNQSEQNVQNGKIWNWNFIMNQILNYITSIPNLINIKAKKDYSKNHSNHKQSIGRSKKSVNNQKRT